MRVYVIGQGWVDMPDAPTYATTAYTGEQIRQIDDALVQAMVGDTGQAAAAQDVLRGGLPAERCDER